MVAQRPTSEKTPRPCLMVPSFVEDVEDLDKFDKFRVLGAQVQLEVVHVMQPQVVGKRLSRSWLEPYIPAPRNKKDIRRLRLTVLDGVLAVCRRLRDGFLTDCVALGEGCWVTAGILSEDIRQAAYKERHVSEVERNEIEAQIERVSHVILLCPAVFPPRSYLPLIRESVPELVCIIPPPQCNVLVGIPTHDSNSTVALELHGWILGSVTETIKLPGPACRTIPKSPLALYQLHVQREPVKIETGPNKPPTLCAEAWAGGAGLSDHHLRGVRASGRADRVADS